VHMLRIRKGGRVLDEMGNKGIGINE